MDRGWMDHQEQPVDQNAPEADRRNVPKEVISVSDGEVDRESTIGGCSSQASCSTTSSDDDSDISEPARSEVSVQDSIMEHAYHSLQNAFTVEEGQLVGGDGTLNQLELLPFHWPLAKLTLPLKFGVNRLEGLVTGFLMELMATRSEPWLCRRHISSFAKTLTVRVATYLAKEIASLFRSVLQHPVMALTDDDTLSLLTSDFWIRPVYEELLYAASRFNRSSGAEHKRPTSNLVKIASFSKDKTSDMMNAGTHHTTMTEWIGADAALNDEGQQYGNLDEASAIARAPRKCLVIWCGDHKQTPGGLRKTDEAKAFRRKLLCTPIALRGDTEHFQPNMLGKVVLRYLDGMDEPLINSIQGTLRATMGGRSVASAEDIATLQSLCQEVGCPYHDELRSTSCCVALVVLWMGLHQEKFPLLATTLQAAAGVSGSQRWALILPSSARVSLVTYTAVIAVRYPELDNVQNDLVCFGNYLLGEQATSGGFLPLFWDAPSAYMHAATDIGSAVDWLQSQVDLSSDENGCLAVLHNRNKQSGSPNQRVRFSPRALHPVQA